MKNLHFCFVFLFLFLEEVKFQIIFTSPKQLQLSGFSEQDSNRCLQLFFFRGNSTPTHYSVQFTAKERTTLQAEGMEQIVQKHQITGYMCESLTPSQVMVKGEFTMIYLQRIFKGYTFWHKYLHILDIVPKGYIKLRRMISCRCYSDSILFKYGTIRDLKMNGFLRIIHHVSGSLSASISPDFIFLNQ